MEGSKPVATGVMTTKEMNLRRYYWLCGRLNRELQEHGVNLPWESVVELAKDMADRWGLQGYWMDMTNYADEA